MRELRLAVCFLYSVRIAVAGQVGQVPVAVYFLHRLRADASAVLIDEDNGSAIAVNRDGFDFDA